ncbi:MAG: TonB-dependent receptor [Deltaproteobacteria bacterium]|nr:TonB-dependent receptor [Deltaproteobacteria bacterium]
MLLIATLVLPQAAFGQDDDGFDNEFALLEEELAADEIESASKHRQSIFWSPSAITVFTREDILASGATSIPDLLRRIPGFDVYEMKPSFPIVGARALTDHSNNLALLIVDGREALIELAGFAIWAALIIDMEEIERIEVIRGPGSTLYGANAFSAVINVTTVAERPETRADVLITGGEIGFRNIFGRVSDSWSLGDGTLSFSASLANGERSSPSDREEEMLQQRVRSHLYLRYQKGNSLDLSLHGGVMDGGGPLYMICGDFNAQVLNHFVMAQAKIVLTDDLSLKVQFYQVRYDGRFHYRSTFKAFEFWLADLPDFIMDTSSYDGQIQIDWRAGDWLQLIGGATVRYTSLWSDKVVAQGLSELRGAGFVQAQFQPWDVLQLTAGFRLDLNSNTEAAFSPRAVLVYRPWDDHAFRIGYALAFRKPSFIESQLHMQVEDFNPAFSEIQDKLVETIGNEAVTNEKVHSIEAGWRARFFKEKLNTSVDLFSNIYKDEIYFKAQMALDPDTGLPSIPNSDFQFENEDSLVLAFGAEGEVSLRLDENWLIWGNLGFRWVTDEDFNRLKSEPILKANLGGRWNSSQGLFVDLAFHYVSTYEMPLILPEKPFEGYITLPLGNSFLLIGRIGYLLKLGESQMETGFTIRTPLGEPFREYPGVAIERNRYSVSFSDWGGEKLHRFVTLYLKGSF